MFVKQVTKDVTNVQIKIHVTFHQWVYHCLKIKTSLTSIKFSEGHIKELREMHGKDMDKAVYMSVTAHLDHRLVAYNKNFTRTVLKIFSWKQLPSINFII